MIAVLTLLMACKGPNANVDDASLCGEDVDLFEAEVWTPVLGQQCVACHVEGAVAGGTDLVLDPDDMLGNLRAASAVADRLLTKPTDTHADGHGGDAVIEVGSSEYDALAFWVDWTEGVCNEPQPELCFEDGAPRRLRRLTHREYERSMSDLLGIDATGLATNFVADPDVDGFRNDADSLVVSGLLADQYRNAAETIVWDAPLPGLCDPGAIGEAACAQIVIEDFGFRAFRRPLSPTELEDYVTFWAEIAQVDGYEEGLRWVMSTLVQSPHFLYRSELGVQGAPGQFALTDWELATQLSYAFWGTTPDAELLQAAADGFTDATLAAQVDRLANDPRTLDTVADLVETWLHLDLLPTVSREGLTDAIRDEMLHETHELVRDVASNNGTLDDLMFARHTFVSPALAAHYGLQGSGRVELDGVQYGGLLTQGSVLTKHARPSGSSPVHRGVLVRERLLCEDLPPPPANLDTSPPPVDPSLSTRQRYEEHGANPECASCHDKIDPLGFAFEHFDGLGRWRNEDAGHAIDATGDVDGVSFDGVFELATTLSEDPRFRTCFVETWQRYTTGAEACADDPGDVGLLDPLYDIVGLEGFHTRLGNPTEGNSLAVGGRPALAEPPDVDLPDPDSFTLTTNNSWGTGYCADGVVTNTGTDDWTWEVRSGNVQGTINNIWNASFTIDGADHVFVGADWNGTLAPGESASFGFCAEL